MLQQQPDPLSRAAFSREGGVHSHSQTAYRSVLEDAWSAYCAAGPPCRHYMATAASRYLGCLSKHRAPRERLEAYKRGDPMCV